MKVYEAIFNEDTTEGVYALSVVESPAMEDLWVKLSKHPEKIDLTLANEEKRLLLGAALIPNKKIYRNVDGNEFYITFSEQTIEKLAHSFFKKGYQNNSSLEHEVRLTGMSVVEGWIVKDPNNDKSNTFGKTYEKGTWVTMMKVDNDEVWEKVKAGEVKGFSIDALIGLQEINFKTEITMADTKSITDAIVEGFKTFFSSNTIEDVKETEEVAETVSTETETVEEPKEDAFDKDAFMQEMQNVLAQFTKNIDAKIEGVKTELSKQVSEKATEIENLKTELAKQPEANPVRPTDPVKEVKLTKQGSLLELLRNNKN